MRKQFSFCIYTNYIESGEWLVTLNPRDFINTNVSVADAISFVISMGTVGATNKILKKSHSIRE